MGSHDGEQRNLSEIGLIGCSLVITLFLAARFWSAHHLGVDFTNDFWVAGHRVLHGISPYAWSRRQLVDLAGFPYMAPAAFLFVPFALVPSGVSSVIDVALLLLATWGALRLLGVRDRRVYAIVFLWWPVVEGWQTGNVTLLLLLLVAAAWRYRDSPLGSGLLVALAISLKPIAWPLVLWLAATRRFRGAAWSIGIAAVLNLVTWAALGLHQIDAWRHVITVQTDLLWRQGYALVALAGHFGAGRQTGTYLTALLTVAIAVWCARLAWRGREREALTIAVLLMIVSSPRVDSHYFSLLAVPIALRRPQLSLAWLVPFLLNLCPALDVSGWQVCLAWAVLSGTTVWAVRGVPPSLARLLPREVRRVTVGTHGVL
jgi:hypothetical protein